MAEYSGVEAWNYGRRVIAQASPLHGMVLYRLAAAPLERSKVLAGTDGRRLVWNESLIGEKVRSLSDAIFILAHEAEHVLRMHMFRRGTRDPQMWNVACDLVINGRLLSAGLERPSGGTWTAEEMIMASLTGQRRDGLVALYDPEIQGMSEEQVYDLLMQQFAGEGGGAGRESGNGQNDCTGNANDAGSDKSSDVTTSGGNGDGDPLPEELRDLDYSNENDAAAQEATRATVQSALEAAVEIAKQRGSVPAYLEELLERVKGWTPKVDWRRRLAHLFRSYTSAMTELTYTRPNRWSMVTGSSVLLPGEVGYGLGKIVVAVDTSGSMSSEELKLAFAELKALVKAARPEEVVVMQVDTKIAEEKAMRAGEFQNWWPDKIHGRGGTSFGHVMRRVEELQPEVLIYFTDGYGDDPEPPKGVPVIWVVIGSEHLSASFGDKVEVEV